jgi:hypothetical protein
MYCPSKEAVSHWLGAAYSDVANRYDIDAVDVTHARYPMFGVPHGVEFCACDDCARSAGALGYDLLRIVSDLRALPARVGSLPAGALTALIEQAPSVPELLTLAGVGASVLDWFALRADLVARGIGGLRDAVKRGARRPVLFGADTYPPAVALVAGHRYADWPSHSDWTAPLLSHIASFLCWGFSAWAERLMGAVPGLGEALALKLVYRITGYDGLDMPLSTAALGRGGGEGEYRHVPIAPLMERDLLKARAHASRVIPCYPIIMGSVWPLPVVRHLMRYADEIGHDGIMLQQPAPLIGYQPRG